MDIKFSNLSLDEKIINLEYINSRISKEVCQETIKLLDDKNLMEEYKKCDSTKNKIDKLNKILINNNIIEETRNKIIDDYILDLIPAGLKGVIRGNKFNKIVEKYIKELNFLKGEDYEIEFEKKSNFYDTNEIPDWYIFNKKTNKIIIGMNQLDLWSGGQQINRGSKYILEFNNTEKVKMVSVVCNEIKFKSEKSKAFNLFKKGYENDTLCHIKNLENIIEDFFKITKSEN